MFLSDHGGSRPSRLHYQQQHHQQQQPVPPVPPRGLRSPKTPMYVPAVLRNNYLKKVASAAVLNGGSDSTAASVGSNHTAGKATASSAPASPFVEESSGQAADSNDYFSIKSSNSRSNSPNGSQNGGLSNSRPSSPAIRSSTSTIQLQSPSVRRRQQRPSRSHWRRDETAASCHSCGKQFTFFERRHHCRRCGEIFCGEHSSHLLRLDAFCNFNPDGLLSRSCDDCARDYSQILQRNEQEFYIAMQQRKQQQKQTQLTFLRASSPDRSLIYYQDPSTKMGLPATSTTNISLPSSASTGLSYSSDHSPQSNAAAHTTTPTNSSSHANTFFSSHHNTNNNNNGPPGGGHVDKHDLAVLANNATALDGRNPSEMPVGSVPADWSWSTF